MPWPCCAGLKEAPPKRRKIDRTMIGDPTNFQHTSHLGGTSDIATRSIEPGSFSALMESKGGHVAESETIPDSNSVASKAIPIVKADPETI